MGDYEFWVLGSGFGVQGLVTPSFNFRVSPAGQPIHTLTNMSKEPSIHRLQVRVRTLLPVWVYSETLMLSTMRLLRDYRVLPDCNLGSAPAGDKREEHEQKDGGFRV